MTHSVNETEMLVLKAARGAKVPLAQAQDIAKAVAYRPTETAIDDFLDQAAKLDKANPAEIDVQGDTVVVKNANALRDFAIAADAIAAGIASVDFLDIPCFALAEAFAATNGLVVQKKAKGLRFLEQEIRQSPTPHRAEIKNRHLESLLSLAALTYVPETEASRLGGAGAGLTDND